MNEVLEVYCCADSVMPKNMKAAYGLFGGYVATCSACDYVCAYWDCACELQHECENRI